MKTFICRHFAALSMNPHLTLTLSPPIGWERRGNSQERRLFSVRKWFWSPMSVQSWFMVLAIFFASTGIAPAQTNDYAANKAEAEKFYADGSYAKAHEIYAGMDAAALPAGEARWVAFRLADTQWRSAAEGRNPDNTALDDAFDSLQKQVRDLTREDQHDLIWAEVEESLGDFYWARRDMFDWNDAWPYYQAALDWWAGQSEMDSARARYLNMVWKMSRPPNAGPGKCF